MATLPRVLAVDPRNDIYDIVRGAMTLLERRFIIIQVPSAADALEELVNTQVNLIVTAYKLPDQNGLDLANRAIRESAGTPIIVLASPDDPEVDPQHLVNAPFSYMVRPASDQFLRALRIGLDGAAAVSAQETSGGMTVSMDLGPIPDIDKVQLRDQLMNVLRDTSSMGGFVADRMGRIVYAEGATGYFDIEVCAATLAPQFAATAKMREFTGNYAWSLQYFDGEEYDLFALSLGLHYFMVLIFDGNKRPQFGPVTNYGRKTADTIAELLGGEAWTFRRSAISQTQVLPAIRVSKVDIPEPPLSEAATQPIENTERPLERAALQLEPVKNLDVERLFSQKIDESNFDELFSDADLSQVSNFSLSGDSVSFDQAMNSGILGE